MTPKFPLTAASDPGLNLRHLELLHHYVTATYTTFSDEDHVQEVWKVAVVRVALAHPYLMYEILAISALHFAFLHPDISASYFTEATELQTQSLHSFNSVQRGIDASNCAPVLLFTSLLALHVLADPSRTASLDSNQYLDHVIHCIMLMRNVQKLVIHEWYDHLKDTELKPMFEVREASESYQVPPPCLELAKLIDTPDLGEEAKEAYALAIDRLNWIYATSDFPHQHYTTVRWILAWPIQLTAAYQERLDQRRPEALVILAYFAAILQVYRKCWAVGDSGYFMVRAISSALGPHWAKWMEWPLSFTAHPAEES